MMSLKKILAQFELLAIKPDKIFISIYPLVNVEIDFINKFVSYNKLKQLKKMILF